MSGINKVILVGHLGKDPEVRYLEGGVSVTSFPLATSESYNKDGRKVEQTTEIVAENFTLLGRKSDFEDDNIKSTIKSNIDMPDDLNADDIL